MYVLAMPPLLGRQQERQVIDRGADRWPFEFPRVQLSFGEHLRRIPAAGAPRRSGRG